MSESNQPIESEETKSSFLFRNLAKGLLWFAVIIAIFIAMEGYIQANFKEHINVIRANPGQYLHTFRIGIWHITTRAIYDDLDFR